MEDLAEGVVAALAPGAADRIYNLVSDEDVSIRRVAETVRRRGRRYGDRLHTGRSGDFGGVEVDGSRARASWVEPSTSFDEGVRRYVASVRESAVASPSRPGAVRRWVDTVRRVLFPLALLGVIVACLAAAGSVEQVIDEFPLAALATTVALPSLLVTLAVGAWTAASRASGRSAGSGFWSLSALLLLLRCALPGSCCAGASTVVLLLLAVAAATRRSRDRAAVPAWQRPRQRLPAADARAPRPCLRHEPGAL